VEAAQHVQRIVQHMQSSAFKFVVAAEHITRCAEAQGLCSSKGGNSVAAGAVYMAHLLGLKKEHDGALLKEVAACSGVHTDTVLRSYRDLQIFQIKN
jgi:transcription initiation factor TFIIIB Brf1 subunit/transcription initiation factor TFIIB